MTDVLEADVLEAGKIKKLGSRSKEWSQQLELAYIDLMDSKKAPYQMQPETNGMPGEWVKEITGTYRLGGQKHIPLISLRKQ